jgi:hypothetical protein
MHSSNTLPARFTWVARPMRRGQRRTLVIGMYAAFASFIASLYFGSTADPRWPLPLAIAAIFLFGVTAAAFIRVVTSPGYAADSLDRALDERQRQVRDRAYRIAYYGLTLLFGGVSLIVLYTPTETLPALAPFLPWLNLRGRQPAVSRGRLDGSGRARRCVAETKRRGRGPWGVGAGLWQRDHRWPQH